MRWKAGRKAACACTPSCASAATTIFRTCPNSAAAIWDATHDKPTICSGCGYCVDYCAYDVLTLKELSSQKEEVVYVGR